MFGHAKYSKSLYSSVRVDHENNKVLKNNLNFHFFYVTENINGELIFKLLVE